MSEVLRSYSTLVSICVNLFICRSSAYAEDVQKAIEVLECNFIDCIAVEEHPCTNCFVENETESVTSSSSEGEEEQLPTSNQETPPPIEKPRKRTLESLLLRDMDM